MTGALSDLERVQIKGHMGYPQAQRAAAFALGIPAAIEISFLIEIALNNVTEDGAVVVRQCLCALNELECLMLGDADLMAVNQVGNIQINQGEQTQLDARYLRWLSKLEQALACDRNPYDKRWAAGGINVRVSG